MDILNLFQGTVIGSGLLMQAESTPLAVLDPEAGQPTADFNDALSNVIGTLLAGQGAPAPTMLPGEERPLLSEEDAPPSAESLLKDDARQQLLETLLMSGRAASPIFTDSPVGLAVSATPPALTLEVKPKSDAARALSVLHTSLASQSVPPASAPTQQPLTPLTQPAPRAAGVDAVPTATVAHVVSQPAAADLTQVMPVAMSTPASVSPSPAPSVGAAVTSTPSLPATTLKMDPEPSRWSEQLQSALGERLQVQVKQQIQHATIRLDPPDMGKIDIAMQIDSGRVQVQINASHAEVYRALQQTSNELRQSLTEQNFVQVNVQVSSQSGGQQQGRGHSFNGQQDTIMAGAEIAAHSSAGDDARRDNSVLLTV
ncbi:flagellar hook-length control protein FliK [Enterobacter quasihormaechei]|uniref:Flagellar hook-length control protein FliK n=1 Tax=Enterobacter quasihormaechei TaxID=2529382 RepID=A0ABU9PG47_9ENTR